MIRSLSSNLDSALRAFPTIIAFLIIMASVVLYISGATNLLLNGIHFTFGVIGYLSIKCIGKFNAESKVLSYGGFSLPKSRYRLLTLGYLGFFSLSTYLLKLYTVRPNVYFGLVLLIYFIVYLQIHSLDLTIVRTIFILVEICLVYLHLAYSLTLRYYHYFGRTDSLTHVNYIENVYRTGMINGIPGIYEAFPLWHILVTIQQFVSGFDWPIWKTMFVVGGFTGLLTIIISYSLGKILLRDKQISLYFSLFVSANPTVIFFTSYSIPRSAIISLTILLFLVLSRRNSEKNVVILIILLSSIVIYHPASPPFLLVLFLGFGVLAYLLDSETGPEWIFYFKLIGVFSILSLSYWSFYSSTLVLALVERVIDTSALEGLIRSPSPPTSPPTETSTSDGLDKAPTSGTSLDQIFDRQYYAPLFTLVLFGLYRIFNDSSKRNRLFTVFAILGFVFYFLMAPSPLDLISKLLGDFHFTRWSQYVFPFVLLLAVVGFMILKGSEKRSQQAAGIVVLVILLSIPLTGYTIAPDNPQIETDRNTGYLLESEVTAFDRVIEYSEEDVYADHVTVKYYTPQTRAERVSYLQYNESNKGFSSPNGGLAIYRIDHATERSIRVQAAGGQLVKVDSNKSDQYHLSRNRVYSSGSVLVMS